MFIGNIEIYNEEIQKVLIAALLGAVLGIERESKRKPAGLRTLALVSAGSALFTVVSYHMGQLGTAMGDGTRIASNIVTGVGFIGAGIIFRGSNHVHGITTAAAVWVSAAIGMTVGNGEYPLAVASTLMVWAVLVVLARFETLMGLIKQTITYKVCFRDDVEGHHIDYAHYFDNPKSYKLDSTKYSKQDGCITIYWSVDASKKKHEQAIQKFLADRKVTEFSYL